MILQVEERSASFVYPTQINIQSSPLLLLSLFVYGYIILRIVMCLSIFFLKRNCAFGYIYIYIYMYVYIYADVFRFVNSEFRYRSCD
jgi:hypothetical protein